MSDRQSGNGKMGKGQGLPPRPFGDSVRWITRLALVVIVGTTMTWLVVRSTDDGLRAQLLTEARIVAHALELDQIQTLTGSEADLSAPAYHRLKDRLASIRRARPNSKFLYLMGQRGNEVFFFVDSEAPDSPDCSPPGQVYEEIAEDDLEVFRLKQERVTGPQVDRWGVWVSALVPLVDPVSGDLLAVLGMDVDATDWRRGVWRSSVAPISGTLLLAVLVVFSVNMRRRDEREKDRALASASALRETENRFRAVFEQAAVGVAQVETGSGHLVRANQKFCELLGHDTATLERTDFHSFIHPDDRAADHQRMERLRSGAIREYSSELRCLRRDGSLRWVSLTVSPMWNAEGRMVHHIAVLQDITERRRVEESHLLLATAVEQSAESIMITDHDAKIVYVNPAFERVSGYSREEALGQNPRIMKSGRHDEAFFDRMWAALDRGDVWSGRIVNRRKDGVLYEEDATISPVLDDQGRVVNYVAVHRDVTREAQLERQFREAQKMEAVGQLAGGVAHDFNNILVVFMIQLAALKNRPGLDAEAREALKELETGARRAVTLTRQLLLFGRRSAMQTHPLDINDVVENLLKMLRRLIGEHIELQFHPQVALPATAADAGMLDQVVMNLVVNARDAMPEGGRLTLATGLAEFGHGAPSIDSERRAGRFVYIAVADTGCGMDDTVLKHIFEPFYTTKEVGKGSGLGLATVYGIAKQHHGWVEVQSTVGQGSEFRVYLPALDAPLATDTAHEPMPEPIRGGREVILLVEDDRGVRSSISRLLQRQGYRVIEAEHGAAALQQWKTFRDAIELLFTDMVMPEGMNGLELAARLRQDRPSLKVILTSGYSEEITTSPDFDGRGIVYLAKPSDPDELARTVRNCLDQRSV